MRHAVTSSTCMEWCAVILSAVVVAGVGAAAVLAGEKIADFEQGLEQAVAGVALAGVPVAILIWIVKTLSLVFKGQGQLILSKAQSMEESVGAAQLGFMANVRDELQVLLGMLNDKSAEDKKKYLLVVSIDNLDRCPHRQIVKVLEAVHLLLEHDQVNVAVILALDPRVIIAAIEEDMGAGIQQEVSGTEYLDKIIHWSFCIPFGTVRERADLLDRWCRFNQTGSLGPSPSIRDGTSKATEAAQPSNEGVGTTERTPDGGSVPTPAALIEEERLELQTMVEAITTTPRKAKRLYNIYSIQRALALKRADRANNVVFSIDNARKLVRWTILAEFWPFRTACLLAVILKLGPQSRWTLSHTLSALYDIEGERCLSRILTGEQSSDVIRDSNSYSRAAAGRLIGMDEADEGFLRVLRSDNPRLLIQDVVEDELGLLHLSFNLNPAMVARVTAWNRLLEWYDSRQSVPNNRFAAGTAHVPESKREEK